MEKNHQVLIVDDEPIVLEAALTLLSAAGLHVTGAKTVAEASLLASTHNFDLAILDMELPDGCGTQIVTQLHRTNSSLPIIFISGIETHPERLSYPHCFLKKPFRYPELLAATNQLIAQRTEITNEL